MSLYRSIRGQAIRAYAGTPANPITGQLWYNTVTKKLMGRNNSGTITITVT